MLVGLRLALWIEFELQMFPAIPLRFIGAEVSRNFHVVLKSIKRLIEQRTEDILGQRLVEGLIGVERFRLRRPNRNGKARHEERDYASSHHKSTVIPQHEMIKRLFGMDGTFSGFATTI